MLTSCSSAYAVNEPGTTKSLQAFRAQKIHAVAGLANPETFFTCLRAAGLEMVEEAFPDHHRYLPGELDYADNLPVLMSEKDAVKCRLLQLDNCWAVPLDIEMNDDFGKTLIALLSRHSFTRHSNIG
jgi:tetraacyldisaccharide 4'-kinase